MKVERKPGALMFSIGGGMGRRSVLGARTAAGAASGVESGVRKNSHCGLLVVRFVWLVQ